MYVKEQVSLTFLDPVLLAQHVSHLAVFPQAELWDGAHKGLQRGEAVLPDVQGTLGLLSEARRDIGHAHQTVLRSLDELP